MLNQKGKVRAFIQACLTWESANWRARVQAAKVKDGVFFPKTGTFIGYYFMPLCWQYLIIYSAHLLFFCLGNLIVSGKTKHTHSNYFPMSPALPQGCDESWKHSNLHLNYSQNLAVFRPRMINGILTPTYIYYFFI